MPERCSSLRCSPSKWCQYTMKLSSLAGSLQAIKAQFGADDLLPVNTGNSELEEHIPQGTVVHRQLAGSPEIRGRRAELDVRIVGGGKGKGVRRHRRQLADRVRCPGSQPGGIRGGHKIGVVCRGLHSIISVRRAINGRYLSPVTEDLVTCDTYVIRAGGPTQTDLIPRNGCGPEVGRSGRSRAISMAYIRSRSPRSSRHFHVQISSRSPWNAG